MPTSGGYGLRILGLVLLAILLVGATLLFLLLALLGLFSHPNDEAAAFGVGCAVVALASLAGLVALARSLRMSRGGSAPDVSPAAPAAAAPWGEYLRYALLLELLVAALGFTYRAMAMTGRPQAMAVPLAFLVLYQAVYVYALIANHPGVQRLPTTIALAYAACGVLFSLSNLLRFGRFYFGHPDLVLQFVAGIGCDVLVAVCAFRARRTLAPGPDAAAEVAGSFLCSAAWFVFLQIFSPRIVQFLGRL